MDLAKLTLSNFGNYLSDEVAETMKQMHIIKNSVLSTLEGCEDILEAILPVENDTLIALDELDEQRLTIYLSIYGSRALGAAAYLAMSQRYYGKSVSEYTKEECMEVKNAVSEKDCYELGLTALGFRTESNNKKQLDEIIVVAVNAAKKLAGKRMHSPEYVKAYMQVLFNAGCTLVASASIAS